MKTENRKLKQDWFSMGLLILMGALFFYSTLEYEFSWDDQIFLSDSNLVDVSNISKVFRVDYWGLIYGSTADSDFSDRAPYYRPIAMAFLMLERWAFKDSPDGFRVVHAAWHVFNAFLLFIFLNKLLGRNHRETFLSAPFLCAALFFFLPYNVDTVLFLTAVGDLISVSFILLCSISFLHWLEKPKVVWLVGIIAASLAASFNKESAVMLPVALTALFVFFRFESSVRKRAALAVAGSVSAVVFYFVVRSIVVDSFATVSIMDTLAGIPAYFWLAVRYAVVPYPLVLEVSVLELSFDVFFWWAGLGCLVIVPSILLMAVKRSPAVSAGIAFWLLLLVPSLLAIKATGFFAPRYLYLPSIGLCLAVSSIVEKSGSAARTAVLAVVICLLFLSFDRAAAWQSSRVLWAVELELQPESTSALINAGLELEKKGEYRDAMGLLYRAAEISDRQGLYSRAGMAYLALARLERKTSGDKDEVLGFLKKSAEANANSASVWTETSSVHAELGDFKKAETAARMAQKLIPTCPDISALVAGSLAGQGKFEEALRELEKARSLAISQPQRLAEIERKTALIKALASQRRRPEVEDKSVER